MQLIKIFAVAASLLASVAYAAPTGAAPSPVKATGTAPAPATVTVPSVAEFKAAFLHHVPADKFIFYTASTLNGAKDFQASEAKANKHWIILGDLWKTNGKYDENYWTKITTVPQMEAHDQFFNRASQAFAELAAGEVVVTMPDTFDPNRGQDSVWQKSERPALKIRKADGHVKTVTERKLKQVPGSRPVKWEFVANVPLTL